MWVGVNGHFLRVGGGIFCVGGVGGHFLWVGGSGWRYILAE